MELKINLATDIDTLRNVKAGTSLLLTGKIYVARDAAHKKIMELVESGRDLPIDFKDKVIYYMGPSPARPGKVIGSCGPTSSYRMDDMLEMTLKLGVAATIGKGERKSFVDDLIREYKAPYLLAIGGAAAYIAECVISAKVVLFEELGAEAVRELEVKDLPVIAAVDGIGNSVFTRG